MSLSFTGKKSLGIVPKTKNPRRGNEIDINIARLGISKLQIKKSLYVLSIFSFL